MKTLEDIDDLRAQTAEAKAKILDAARTLRGHIGLALDMLSDRDRDLLISQYNLEPFGFRRRTELLPQSSAARRVALYRARSRFYRLLKTSIEEALASGDERGTALTAALSIVEGKEIEESVSEIETRLADIEQRLKLSK